MSHRPHSVLIPVANPRRAAEYIDLGARIVRRLESELILLSIELVEQEELQEATRKIDMEPDGVLQEARKHAESIDAPVSLRTLEAQEVAEAIVSAAQEPNVDYLIMGWRGDEEGGHTVIGRKIDGLVREADAHALIMQQGTLKENERVLLPVLNTTLPPLALAVASLLAQGDDAHITLLHLAPGPLNDEDQQTFRDALFSFDTTPSKGPEVFINDPDCFEVEFEMTDDPQRVLVERSPDYDRLLLEAGQAHVLTEKVHGEDSSKLAEEVQCPLIFVRTKNTGVKFGL